MKRNCLIFLCGPRPPRPPRLPRPPRPSRPPRPPRPPRLRREGIHWASWAKFSDSEAKPADFREKRPLRSARAADHRSPHTKTHLGDVRQCNEPKRPGRAHGKFRFSGLSRGRDRRRQATAGDRMRPHTTAGDRRRASTSAAKKTSRLDYTALKRHPALSQRLGASRTSERRRWAEASEDRAKAAQRSAGQMTRAAATSRFTPPRATALA